MHYLEDAVELLEYLPEELRKKCDELRQLDAQYTVGFEKVLKDSHAYFANLKSLTPFESEQKDKELQEKFQTVRDISEGKVRMAEYLQLVLEKYQERIGKDLAEFKAELEVDNPGETELIEKNFMQSIASSSSQSDLLLLDNLEKMNADIEHQMDAALKASNSESGLATNRLNGHRTTTTIGETDERTPTPQQRSRKFDDFRIPANIRRSSQQLDSSLAARIPAMDSSSSSIFDEDIFDAELTPPAKKLKPAPPPRVLALASDTMPPSSLDHHKRETSIPSVQHPTTPTALSATPSSSRTIFEGADFAAIPGALNIRMPLLAGTHASRHGRPRKLTKKVEQMLIGGPRPRMVYNREGGPSTSSRSSSLTRGRPPATSAKRKRKKEIPQQQQEDELESVADEEEDSYSYDEEEEDEEEEGEEEEADDNRTWCICKQCPFEWFHYECVGITQEPQGEWYCPTCKMHRNNMQNRSRSGSSDVPFI